MPSLYLPNSATIHTARSFLAGIDFNDAPQHVAELTLHPKWVHLEPIALAAAAAWGTWCRSKGLTIDVKNIGQQAAYAARMKLFDQIGVTYTASRVTEHEEAGRFLPITNVLKKSDIGGVIGSVSALLHLQGDTESLAAVQYCVSELLRNALEHSDADLGAFVCAHNYVKGRSRRVSIAVADCGQGISHHLGRRYSAALTDDATALQFAMLPGVTGAQPGLYGTPENAGAGLFITRCIAKGTGGYFLIRSGNAAYRLHRARTDAQQGILNIDPLADRHNNWVITPPWIGTLVAVEIRTDRIGDFEGYFDVIRKLVPAKVQRKREIRFT